MEKYIPVVVIKELSETDKILLALKTNGINCAEITFRIDCAYCKSNVVMLLITILLNIHYMKNAQSRFFRDASF